MTKLKFWYLKIKTFPYRGSDTGPPPPPHPLCRFASSFCPPCWKFLATPVDKTPTFLSIFTPPFVCFPSAVWGVVQDTQHPPPLPELGDGIISHSLWNKQNKYVYLPPPPPFLVTGWGVVKSLETANFINVNNLFHKPLLKIIVLIIQCVPIKRKPVLSMGYLHCHAILKQTVCFILKSIFSSFIWYQTHNDISMHEWTGTI